MVLILRKRYLLLAAFLLAGGLLAGASRELHSAIAAFQAGTLTARPTIVIDAGHGGEDGGAVGTDGSRESDINLAIALRTEELLAFLGYETLLTRDADVSIHDSTAQTLRQKKVSDLKNRVTLVNQAPQAVLLSIHQNALPGAPATQGAQAFHNRASSADSLAQSVQTQLNALVNGAHPKEKRQISDSIYLMKQVTHPAVLVECGFMTHPQEVQLLQSAEHQQRLAVAMVAGLCEGLCTEERGVVS